MRFSLRLERVLSAIGHVDSDETGLVTLNGFLRHAKPDTRYYFGGTVDYHC